MQAESFEKFRRYAAAQQQEPPPARRVVQVQAPDIPQRTLVWFGLLALAWLWKRRRPLIALTVMLASADAQLSTPPAPVKVSILSPAKAAEIGIAGGMVIIPCESTSGLEAGAAYFLQLSQHPYAQNITIQRCAAGRHIAASLAPGFDYLAGIKVSLSKEVDLVPLQVQVYPGTAPAQ